MNPTIGDPPPEQQEKASPAKLGAMNESAKESASGTEEGKQKCPLKKSWFSIKFVHDKGGAGVDSLTVKLKIPELGEVERVTAKPGGDFKIECLTPGGTGDVNQVAHPTDVWEASGDIT